jgi:hypothetical protein
MTTPSLTVTRTASPLHRNRSAGRSSTALIWWVIAASLAALVALPILGSGAVYVAFSTSPDIAPGVRVAGLSVGGVSMDEAAAALDVLWNKELRLQVVDPPTGRTWTVFPAELGLAVDARRTAERAFSVGRRNNPVEALHEAASSLQQGTDLDPWVTFDRNLARQTLARMAGQASTPVQAARPEIVAGTVRVIPGRDGRDLDIEGTLDLIAADPTALLVRYGFVPLIFTSHPAPVDEAIAAAAEVDRLLAAPASIQAYDPVTDERLTWTPDRLQIGDWVVISEQGPGFEVSLDAARIAPAAQDWSTALGDDRRIDPLAAADSMQASMRGESTSPLIVTYLPTSYITQGGETLAAIGYRHGLPTWKIEEYNPGVNAREWLAAGTSITLPPRDAMLLLPVVADKRIVISISEQRLWTYQNGALRSDHVISTGIARSPTLPGLFQVLSHIENAYASRWDLWMPNFLGIYDALPGFTNGIHGLPLLSSGVRLWGNVLGRPASYGCIILDLKAAEETYAWAEDGVVVEIRR